jgi:multiple sugar transport system substrate-binding protein
VPPVLVVAFAFRRILRSAAAAPLASAALALVLAGCGSDGTATAPAKPIEFVLTADAAEAQVWLELARAYEQQTGGRVQVTPIPDREALLQRLGTAFAARRPPDVFLLNHRYLGPFLREGLLAAPDVRDGIAERPLQAFTVDGEPRCVPLNASSLVVYVNEDLVPDPPSSYEELVATARSLRLGEDRHAVGIEPSLIRAAPFVWSAGGELVDDEAAPTRFTLDTPQARKGLQRLLDLAELGPSRTDVESRGLSDRFLAGQLGMYFDSRREVPAFREIEDFDWDVVRFPGDTSVLHTDGLCVAADGDAEAAKAFVDFASGPEGQRLLARSGRIVPSLEGVDVDLAPPASSQVWVDQLPDLRSLPTTRDFGRVEEEADLALEEAFYGELTLDEAIERIERRTSGRFG